MHIWILLNFTNIFSVIIGNKIYAVFLHMLIFWYYILSYTIRNYFITYLEAVINPNPLSLIHFPNAYQHTLCRKWLLKKHHLLRCFKANPNSHIENLDVEHNSFFVTQIIFKWALKYTYIKEIYGSYPHTKISLL